MLVDILKGKFTAVTSLCYLSHGSGSTLFGSQNGVLLYVQRYIGTVKHHSGLERTVVEVMVPEMRGKG